MKRILLSLLTIVTVGTLATVATTQALFSDTETSEGNTFAAGTLELEIGTHASFPINVTNTKPGEWNTAWIKLNNVGTVQGQVKFASLTKTLDKENGCNSPEATVDTTCGNPGNGKGELDENLIIVLWDDVDSNDVFDGGETYFFQALGLDNIAATPKWSPSSPITIAPGATQWLKVRWDILGSVGNIIQSDSATFTLTFDFEQYP